MEFLVESGFLYFQTGNEKNTQKITPERDPKQWGAENQLRYKQLNEPGLYSYRTPQCGHTVSRALPCTSLEQEKHDKCHELVLW